MTTTSERVAVRDRIYIDGEWVETTGDGAIEVINPSTEEVIGSVPQGTAEDVDRAVAAAARAFETWSQTTVEERAEWLGKIAAALGERQDEIAGLISDELGMPLGLSRLIQAGLPITTFGSLPGLM